MLQSYSCSILVLAVTVSAPFHRHCRQLLMSPATSALFDEIVLLFAQVLLFEPAGIYHLGLDWQPIERC